MDHTVASYVRENFWPQARKYIAYAVFAVPGFAAIKARQFSLDAGWELIGAALGAIVLASILACAMTAFALALNGWWRLRVGRSPALLVGALACLCATAWFFALRY